MNIAPVIKPNGKTPFFRNIELLRFLIAWAVVLIHLNLVNGFNCYALNHLRETYFSLGYKGVPLFFIIAFFFLALKTRPEQRLFDFVKNKWLRLAPLFIACSFVAFILYKVGIMHMHNATWTDEIEAHLLVNEFISSTPAGMYSTPYWFCAVYMLMAVFYLGLIKALPQKSVPFALGVLSYIAWRTCMLSEKPALMDQCFIGTYRTIEAVYCLGFGYLLSFAYKNYHSDANFVSLKLRIMYSCAEVACMVVIFSVLFIGKAFFSHFIFLSAFAWLIWSFINRLGVLSILLDKNWCAFLGRYSYAIYATHPLVLYTYKYTLVYPPLALSKTHEYQCFINANPCIFLCLLLLSVMIVAMLGHHLVEVPIIRYFSKRDKPKCRE